MKLFNTLHPVIKIRVICATTPTIISLLKAGRIDFGLINMPFYDEQLLIQFAQYDFGIACVIKNFIEDELSSGRLYEVKPIEKIPSRSIAAAWLKNVALAPAAKEFINNLDYFETSDI